MTTHVMSPGQAQFRALRAAAALLTQLAADLKSDDDARHILSDQDLTEMEVQLGVNALANLAAEMTMRADQVFDANTDFIQAILRRN